MYECDYDSNQTVLYQYLESEKWDSVPSRIKEFPTEVRTWIKRQDGLKIKWRMLPLHAAILFNAPHSVIEALLDAYQESIKCQDDMGMLPLHLVLRRSEPDHETVDLIMNRYPGAVIVKDSKGRTPTVVANNFRNLETETRDAENTITNEERITPFATILPSEDGDIETIVEEPGTEEKIQSLQNVFQSQIYDSLNKGTCEMTFVHQETEKFVLTLMSVLKESHFEHMKYTKMENERQSTLNNILKDDIVGLKRQLKESQEQCDLYKTIMKGSKRKYEHANSAIESMTHIHEQLADHMLRQRREVEAAHMARCKIIRDLLHKEDHDYSMETKAGEVSTELMNSLKTPTSRQGQNKHSDSSILQLKSIPESKDHDITDDISAFSEMTQNISEDSGLPFHTLKI
mmetsp:Transcript_1654/g.1808  ORF Transcript_1654/g.1808 Transcript_1654/m.1808 type:complete len:402 (+) Transcript_1654:50-1255(+)